MRERERERERERGREREHGSGDKGGNVTDNNIFDLKLVMTLIVLSKFHVQLYLARFHF